MGCSFYGRSSLNPDERIHERRDGLERDACGRIKRGALDGSSRSRPAALRKRPASAVQPSASIRFASHGQGLCRDFHWLRSARRYFSPVFGFGRIFMRFPLQGSFNYFLFRARGEGVFLGATFRVGARFTLSICAALMMAPMETPHRPIDRRGIDHWGRRTPKCDHSSESERKRSRGDAVSLGQIDISIETGH